MKSLYDLERDSRVKQYYKIKAVAKLLDLSEKTIRRWIREGKLKAVKIGGSIRISKDEIANIIKPTN